MHLLLGSGHPHLVHLRCFGRALLAPRNALTRQNWRPHRDTEPGHDISKVSIEASPGRAYWRDETPRHRIEGFENRGRTLRVTNQHNCWFVTYTNNDSIWPRIYSSLRAHDQAVYSILATI